MKSTVVIMIGVLLFLSCAGGPNYHPIEWVKSSTNDYGFSDENPIRIGYHKEPGANIQLCRKFISCLRNNNGEEFKLGFRGSYPDPNYKLKQKGFLGFRKRGSAPQISSGILDGYQLISESDTIILFFDIYQAEPISIPSGLEYVCPTDSTNDPLIYLLQIYQ